MLISRKLCIKLMEDALHEPVRMNCGPDVARIKLPQRVPFGFHGSYIPDAH